MRTCVPQLRWRIEMRLIGIRMALGARMDQVCLWLFFKE